jgi:2-C-methyl-D-erythritol 4-phosphate cytidylyltransferase
MGGLSFAILVVGAGASTRMGFDKTWAELGGQPLLAYALDAARQAAPAEVVLVVAEDRLAHARALAPEARVVAGGARRRDSVGNGIAVTTASWVAIHDAARAFAPSSLFAAGLKAAQPSGAAIPILPVKDTIKQVRDGYVLGTLPRAEHVIVQTPQVFRRDLLERALASAQVDVTDESTLVESLGVRVATFAGDERAFKLTTPLDFAFAQTLFAAGAGAAPG